MDFNWLRLYDELLRIDGYLNTLVHPNVVLAHILDDSIGLLLNVWFGFVLTTTDLESHREFIQNAAIQRFEPVLQIVANAALVVVAMWAAYRIMWGHGLFTQYTARIMLPRLVLAVVLINFALPLFQMGVDAANTVSGTMVGFNTYDDLTSFKTEFEHNPNVGTWELVTTMGLAGGYGVLAIAYLLRFAVLVLLAITAPVAALLFMLPETHAISKTWMSHFTTNLVMQPAQLFVLSVGFALERYGISPMHHLFALATLLIAFKVPGAFGASEKVAHKLQHTMSEGFKHLGHTLARA
ncbi:MAG TPA: hypothetical protein VFL27_08490 [Candidatus Dormibacteraeota bacterium]|nr:hypothetical protein [Candidatus Dormibacteraeota bacterium]